MIALRGPRVKEFLQGYVTCNTDNVCWAQPLLMAITNLQGRVVANGWLRGDDNEIILLVHASLAARVVEFLQPYARFSRCEISVLELPVLLEQDAEASAAIVANWHWQQPTQPSQASVNAMIDNVSDVINHQLVQLSQVLISAPVSEKFLPQMLRLDKNGTVDFDKGCYLGQEVIARAQFRGAVKRRIAVFSWNGREPELNESWTDQDGTKGSVVQVCRDSEFKGRGLWVRRV